MVVPVDAQAPNSAMPLARIVDNSYPKQLASKATHTQNESFPRRLAPKATRTLVKSYKKTRTFLVGQNKFKLM